MAKPSLAATLPWAVIPVPAAVVAWWACERCGLRLRGRSGWRGRVCVLADSGRLTTRILMRPVRHWTAVGGIVAFWSGEISLSGRGLVAGGFRMNGAALVVGFATGMVFTRRMAPLAGAGILTVILSLAIGSCGAPLAVTVTGIVACRALTLWLPMPFALAAVPVLRQISEGSLETGEARSEAGALGGSGPGLSSNGVQHGLYGVS